MSQNLTPVANSAGTTGLSPQLNTTTTPPRPKLFSEQFKDVKGYFPQPTQWNPAGRPIYGRLPAASEQYQLDFFEEGGRGYVFIPRGGDQFGPGSLYVNQSENRDVLLIEDGVIVWEEGTTPVLKTFLDFQELGVEDGRYLVCYQLIYDDAPEPFPFQVDDFCLAGLNITVDDSASATFRMSGDVANPWPFPGEYMFAVAEENLAWKSYIDLVNRTPGAQVGVEPGLPDYEQPILNWVSWETPIAWKLDKIKIRTLEKDNVPNCTLYVASLDPDADDPWTPVQEIEPRKDSQGFFWEFETDYEPQRRWKVQWPNETKVSATALTVSGLIYLETRPTTPRARAQLAMYPTNLVPDDVSLCKLAVISVDNYQIPYKPSGELWKDDVREIINRDYEPVADWLTEYWDEQLIALWEDVRHYTPRFMAPPTLLKQSYVGLERYGIDVNSDIPFYPIPPDKPIETLLIGSTVSLFPPLPTNPSLSGASVVFTQPPGAPTISEINTVVL